MKVAMGMLGLMFEVVVVPLLLGAGVVRAGAEDAAFEDAGDWVAGRAEGAAVGELCGASTRPTSMVAVGAGVGAPGWLADCVMVWVAVLKMTCGTVTVL